MPSRRSEPARLDVLDPPLLAACQKHIARQFGLHFPPERWPDLMRHLHQLAEDTGFEHVRELAQYLLTPPTDPVFQRKLIARLTVGETYFFRDPGLFDQLADTLLKPLIAKRRSAGYLRLRLWSAGCCTGEEAYTLAMLVDSLLPDADAWRIEIIGTDLNPAFLSKARSGCYGAWSFRQSEAAWRVRYFESTPDNCWQIDRRIQQWVQFHELNLASATYPDSERGLNHCDLILCRNVLMYFSPAQASAVLGRLHDALTPEGVLLVAAVEGGICQRAGYATELWSGALCLSRSSKQPMFAGFKTSVPERPQVASQSWSSPGSLIAPKESVFSIPGSLASSSPLATSSKAADLEGAIQRHEVVHDTVDRQATLWKQAQTAWKTGDYHNALNQLDEYWQSGRLSSAQQADAALLYARIHANLKQLDEAAQWAEEALRHNSLESVYYWVMASVRLEQGDVDAAQQNLTKALYLNPDFILAHYLKGHLYLRQQQPERAGRHFETCRALLSNLAPDSPVPEGEGLNATQLQQLVQAAQPVLEGQAGD